MINVAICGIGRAGAEVIKTLWKNDQFNVVAAFCRVNSEKAGKDIGDLCNIGYLGINAVEITYADQILGNKKIDVVIDFSNPSATKTLLNACLAHGVPGVICTTGFTDDEVLWMTNLTSSHKIGIVYAPNVTLGVNVLLALLKTVTHVLPDFDYQITEVHHNRKTDIPSGTAKRIAETIECELTDSHAKSVPINSVRAGGYVGIHEVLAAGDCERLSITHESFSRKAFAQGAMTAAKFILHRKGWYCMEDVIDINTFVNHELYDPNLKLNRA